MPSEDSTRRGNLVAPSEKRQLSAEDMSPGQSDPDPDPDPDVAGAGARFIHGLRGMHDEEGRILASVSARKKEVV